MIAEIFEIEEPAEQRARAVGDDERVRFRGRLHLRGHRQRPADRHLFQRALARLVVDHETRRDPDARFQRRSLTFEILGRLDDR